LELFLRTASTPIVYCAIDEIISTSNHAPEGFEEFLEELVELDIPCVWVTSRNRMQMDATIRKFGHSNPFIGEGGCGVFVPADYFHLKPSKTTRMGRFICIPAATPQPAAAEALDQLASDTGVTVVPLRALSPRELSQNTGFAQREAELVRQRDFDELFFFAGTSEVELQRFQKEAAQRKWTLRPRGSTLWSLSIGPDLRACIKELSLLYDRALRGHATTIALATEGDATELFPCCDRSILLSAGASSRSGSSSGTTGSEAKILSIASTRAWEQVLEQIKGKRV
jgi:mannosyl-3-phosphoglycerate phosphatase